MGSTGALGSSQGSWHNSRPRCRLKRRAIHLPPIRLGVSMRCSGERGGPHRSICGVGRSVRNRGSARCSLCRLALRRPISCDPLHAGPRMRRRISHRQSRHSCGIDMSQRGMRTEGDALAVVVRWIRVGRTGPMSNLKKMPGIPERGLIFHS